MRIIPGDRWWQLRGEVGPFEAWAWFAALGLIFGAASAWWIEPWWLAQFSTIYFGLLPFGSLPMERMKRDPAFQRRYGDVIVTVFLIGGNVVLWSALYLGQGRVDWWIVGFAMMMTAALVQTVVPVVWGLILSPRWGRKPGKAAGRNLLD